MMKHLQQNVKWQGNQGNFFFSEEPVLNYMEKGIIKLFRMLLKHIGVQALEIYSSVP